MIVIFKVEMEEILVLMALLQPICEMLLVDTVLKILE